MTTDKTCRNVVIPRIEGLEGIAGSFYGTPKDAASFSAKGDDLTEMLNEKGVCIPIENQPWSKFYSEARASVHAGWDGRSLALAFSVEEKAVRAVNRRDNDPVYQDSCVEFFVSPEGSSCYYNFEFNALGHVLAAAGPDRFSREFSPEAIRKSIIRIPCLAKESFDESGFLKESGFCSKSSGDSPLVNEDMTHWNLTVVLPVSVFFRDSVESFQNLQMRGNFYKCGDLLPNPHYQCWSAIDTPEPDFHRPEFFGKITTSA